MSDGKKQNDKFQIGNRFVGEDCPTYVIAEMSANHAGSLERAKEIIHAAKESGADCIKIQTYTPDTLTIDCNNEYFCIKSGTWEGENLYSLYGKAYTPWEWQGELKEEADRVGIDFLSTPFDRTAVDFLEEMNISFYKIASFELVDIPLIEYVASKGKPIIMSTGMGSLEEIEEAVEAVYRQGNHQLAIMKCSSAYPAKVEEMNLSTITDLKKRFRIPVGLSDHSMGSFSATTAVAMGAGIIEKHFCLSRSIKNPDSSFSMEPEEFKQMVKEIREVEKAKGVVTYGVSEQERSNACFRRSLFVVKDIARGELLTSENIRSIRPAYGMKPKYYKQVLGRRANKPLTAGTPLRFEDLEELTLRRAEPEDIELLFRWANDPVTRQNAFHTEPITWEEHRKWFTGVLWNQDVVIYIGMAGEEPVGQLRFNMTADEALISYSVAPSRRGSGIGTKLLELSERQLKAEYPRIKTCRAEVKNGNSASIRVFEKNGYHREDGEAFIVFTKKV